MTVDTTQREVEEHQADSGAHHTRYSDSEARAATDGQIDADTVDGLHASDLGNSVVWWSETRTLGTNDSTSGTHTVDDPVVLSFSIGCDWNETDYSLTFNYADGSSDSFSASSGNRLERNQAWWDLDMQKEVTSIDFSGSTGSYDADIRWRVLYAQGKVIK
jgi:hypothetical protein